MPLIVVSGNPCCGKTTVVNELVSKLESNGLGVVVVSEDGLGLRRNDSYKGDLIQPAFRSEHSACPTVLIRAPSAPCMLGPRRWTQRESDALTFEVGRR